MVHVNLHGGNNAENKLHIIQRYNRNCSKLKFLWTNGLDFETSFNCFILRNLAVRYTSIMVVRAQRIPDPNNRTVSHSFQFSLTTTSTSTDAITSFVHSPHQHDKLTYIREYKTRFPNICLLGQRYFLCHLV